MKKLTAAAIMSALMSLPVFAPVLAEQPESVPAAWQIEEESGLLLVGDQPAEGQKVVQEDSIAMYRLYNPNSGEHFYTGDTHENDQLVEWGWKSEGIGWYAPASSEKPVYRLYNGNAGDHHYTTSLEERDALVGLGWSYEKVGWYSAGSEGQPVYRQYNPNAKSGSHNYTTDVNENDVLGRSGWKLENIGWYGMRLSCPPAGMMQDLETRARRYQELLAKDRSGSADLEGLKDSGMELASLLSTLSGQFENRYYVFQNGRLAGSSSIGSNAIALPDLQPGNVMILQAGERKIQLAERIENNMLQGNALYLRSTGGTTRLQAATGIVRDGLFEGGTAGYIYIEDPSNEYEEYSYGQAVGNLLNGTIQKHTRYFKSSSTRLKEFDWTIEVDNGKARYEKIGNYYYVCRANNVNVYYDYLPVNLSFWPVAG